MYEISVEDTFDSAHCLTDYDGACSNLHGHTYRTIVRFRFSELGSSGMAIDFAYAKKVIQKILSILDHQYINDVKQFKDTPPSAENISSFIFYQVKQQIPQVHSVSVWETPTNCATFFED